MKTCNICGGLKEASSFHVDRSRIEGIRDYCKDCASETQKKVGEDGLTNLQRFHLKNPEKRLEYNLEQNYSLSVEQFKRLLSEQGNACAICGDVCKLCVDHCHSTGKVRALLCSPCNVALGGLRDSVSVAIAAVEYLKKHGTS